MSITWVPPSQICPSTTEIKTVKFIFLFVAAVAVVFVVVHLLTCSLVRLFIQKQNSNGIGFPICAHQG